MALLLASECKKKNVSAPFTDALVRNFVNRRLFYKSGTNELVLQGTSTKTYLPKEKVGAPSKWNTFYYWLARS